MKADTPSERRTTLLLVEDEEQIRKLVRLILAPLNGLDVYEAGTGASGLKLAQSLDRQIDILLTDMLLPELSGYDLALAMRELFPALRIIMVTGYVEGEIVQRGIAELGAAFLDKPFQAAELRQLVSDAMVRPLTTSLS
ncbi:MAG: response regulator [Bryobacteraceae bacterium]|nr:response regulator [Bryobacteraceae bacterium]